MGDALEKELREALAAFLAENFCALAQALEVDYCARGCAFCRLARAHDALGEESEQGPYVCPGCHAIAEACAPGCPDAAIERALECDDALDGPPECESCGMARPCWCEVDDD
jgi:hypothetical protein